MRPRRVADTVLLRPVVIAQAADSHPFAIATIDFTVAFNPGFTVVFTRLRAVPELQRDAVGVNQVDLLIQHRLDENIALILTRRNVA
ncbi:hypothetical protein SDC9_177624 [bioreactor metagenome]|uniref:Uncharacterized protein n=1 Tax=bioreactor metagenome TaxID=1076179 RepID=A0A645GV80_9ZZZZ